MPRSVITLIAWLAGAVLATTVHAQDVPAPLMISDAPCSSCHTCEEPTPQNLCLRGCSREAAKEEARERSPDVVILDELEELYLPVPFDHKGHAEMAEMTQGCVVCHHYTPAGAAHPACKSCHEVSPVREDMRKPSLKAAYHRQCMACHREWSHETACGICHPPKAGRGSGGYVTTRPTKDDIVGSMHPPIPEPEVEIYQTKYKYVPGTKVVFRHKEHIHRFGLKCVECHREDNCLRCHEEGKEHTQRVKTLEEHHQPCSDCHATDKAEKCDRCHWEEGSPQPPPFDHAETGWPLSDYHKDNGCRACHKAPRFAKLDRDCNSCHADWKPGRFDHAITGQALDENHAETDCEECHIDRKFDRPPSCTECHDETEGITFPAKRPGKVVAPKAGAPGAQPSTGDRTQGPRPSQEKQS